VKQYLRALKKQRELWNLGGKKELKIIGTGSKKHLSQQHGERRMLFEPSAEEGNINKKKNIYRESASVKFLT